MRQVFTNAPTSCRIRHAILLLTLTGSLGFASTSVAAGPADVSQLQLKADLALPKERCFLYAELVSKLTESAGMQLQSGDSVQAMETLRTVQLYADRIQAEIREDSKKLKPAESLLRLAARRLNDILHDASYDDRPALELTLSQLNTADTRVMMEVFRRP